MVEQGIKGGICHSIYRYAKANNKYMKYCDKNKELSYLQYWDVNNNLYGWAMSQKLPVNIFECIDDTSEVNKDFIKSYNEVSEEGYFQVDVQSLEELHELDNDLPFLPGRMKIENIEKLVANLHDKTEYVIHIRNLKQALNHGLLLSKVNRAIKFNESAWIQPNLDMNTDLRKKAIMMNNAIFEEKKRKM